MLFCVTAKEHFPFSKCGHATTQATRVFWNTFIDPRLYRLLSIALRSLTLYTGISAVFKHVLAYNIDGKGTHL